MLKEQFVHDKLYCAIDDMSKLTKVVLFVVEPSC